MMDGFFREYKPDEGWIAYRKRKAFVKKIKTTFMALAGLVVFATTSLLCETI